MAIGEYASKYSTVTDNLYRRTSRLWSLLPRHFSTCRPRSSFQYLDQRELTLQVSHFPSNRPNTRFTPGNDPTIVHVRLDKIEIDIGNGDDLTALYKSAKAAWPQAGTGARPSMRRKVFGLMKAPCISLYSGCLHKSDSET